MFIVALFTIAKTWKQPKCPSKNEWVKKMWYMYTMEHQSAINKNEIMPFAATWMDLEITILSEVKSDRERQIYVITYMQNLKYDSNELIYKTETDSQTQKTNLQLPKGKGRGGINQESGINRYTLFYIKQINNKVLQQSTGNYIQYFVITYNGNEYEKEYTYIYV